MNVGVRDIATTATLIVGTTQVFSTNLNSNVQLAQDEGLDYVSSTIAGVQTVFSSPYNEGPVLGIFPNFPYGTPSGIGQDLLLGIFFPQAVPLYFINSFIGYDGQVADLTSLTVSAVPLPATLPLFASGLAGLAWLAGRGKRSEAAQLSSA